MKAHLSSVVLFTGLLFGACTTPSTSSVITGPPIAQAEFPAQYASALCDQIEKCCTANSIQFTAASCTEQTKKNVQAALDKELAKGKGVTFDSAIAGDCVAKLRHAVSDMVGMQCNPSDDFDPDISTCVSLVHGTTPPGGACDRREECAQTMDLTATCRTKASSSTSAGSTSATTSTADAGASEPSKVCIQLKKAEAGAPCMGETVTLDPSVTYSKCEVSKNLFCNPVTNKCESRGDVGANCQFAIGSSGSMTTGSACKIDLICDRQSKKCANRKSLDESCEDPEFKYADEICKRDLFCDPTSKKCAARKAGGEACTPYRDTASGGSSTDGNSGVSSSTAPSYLECKTDCDSATAKCRANSINKEACQGTSLVFD